MQPPARGGWMKFPCANGYIDQVVTRGYLEPPEGLARVFPVPSPPQGGDERLKSLGRAHLPAPRVGGRADLLAELEPLGDGDITRAVGGIEVVQEPAPLPHQHQ